MKHEQAQTLSIQVLGWLANEPERLGHFLNASGASVDDLRHRAGEPEFLESVLDFLMLDDEMIIAFAQETRLDPESIQRARYTLSGDISNGG